MKKLLAVSLLCTAMLCGCSAGNGEEISETSALETSTVFTDSEVEAAVKENIILTPIPLGETLEVTECKIFIDIVVDNEEDFCDKEAIKYAREICFEKAHNEIEREKRFAERGLLTSINIETAEDIVFSCGMAFDFDNDGSTEYVIALDFSPLCSTDGGFLIFMDDSEYEIFSIDCEDIASQDMRVGSIGKRYFPMVTLFYSDQRYGIDIYSFESNKPQNALNFIDESHIITGENGIFYLYIENEDAPYPFVICEDGIFRQFGREKITREDFEAHIKNGGAYLNRLAEDGDEITDIYTYGYYSYKLYGNGFCYDVYCTVYNDDKYTFLTCKREMCDGQVPLEFRFTDEVIYGDVWTAKPVYDND